MRFARRNAEGFVLVATLWAVAALAVLAAWLDGVVTSEIERAVTAKRSLQSELHRRGTEATLIYLFTTGRMNHRGLILEEEQRFSDALAEGDHLPDDGDGALRMAGEVYLGLGDSRFSVQDEGGLASVNAPGSPLFLALLEHKGIAASDIERVVARVEDYIDTDSDVTLNGAERHDYRQEGAPPPPNWIMSSPMELRKVLGINEILAPAQWRELRPLLTVRPVFGYNFNTMRPEILAAVLGLDEQGVRRVLDERQERANFEADADRHAEREAPRHRRDGGADPSLSLPETHHLARGQRLAHPHRHRSDSARRVGAVAEGLPVLRTHFGQSRFENAS